MSEYMEKHTVSKIIGSPPGYVGFAEGGQLTEKVRRKPYSVILFDEIEKAHEDVFNILLQIMEDGRLTDSQGRKVDFKNAIIVMTSNVGARSITDRRTALGFVGDSGAHTGYEEIRRRVTEELKKTFRPEFINRIDDIIVFHPLSRENIRAIAANMMQAVKERMEAVGVTLRITDGALDKLADGGYDASFGARPLRRAIQTRVEDAVAEKLLDGSLHSGSVAEVRMENGQLVIRTEEEE
jgi:ATP-dependent Clp protease ATP-binding subunit ClpC